MTDYKDTTSRHLRHKLQSLGRRLDELEEAASKIQKSEDELLDLQDKIIQAEGSGSPLLNDVEALRKRVLKIEGKDEEVRKAEDLCRLVREKLEEEENLTKELKLEIERLQKRMSELEKLEEAFSKSKSDCSQLCLSLNEEKNMTKKLSSELEVLKTRMKEVDSSESRLDKAEQALTLELETLKTLAQTFVSERKKLLEKQKEDERAIHDLTEKLEYNNRINSIDQRRNAPNLQEKSTETGDIRIEDDLSPGLTSKLGLRKKSFDFLVKYSDEVTNEKNSSEGQEDNKVKDLLQENERLKNIEIGRLKKLEMLQEDLKKAESKNEELLEKFQQERNNSKALNDQVEQLKLQLCEHAGGVEGRVLENGKAENDEIGTRGGFRQEKPKHRSIAPDSPISRHRAREVSPQQRREKQLRSKDLEDSSPKSSRRALSPLVHKPRRTRANPSADVGLKDKGKTIEERTQTSSFTSANVPLSDGKKPSVLSRYPPAANDQKSWKSSAKSNENEKKSRSDKFSRCIGSDTESNHSDALPENSDKVSNTCLPEKELVDQSREPSVVSKANGPFPAYKSRVLSLLSNDQGSEGHSSASETESTGSRHSAGEAEPVVEVNTMSGKNTTPKYNRYSRLQESRSEGSSTRSSFEDEQSRPLMPDAGPQESVHMPSGIEIRRVCSPREALMSKAVIKPAIVEIDKKEVMMSGGRAEPLPSSGKPKISTKPILSSKMTSSITIYPSDPSSSRTSSRSSSVSSEPPRERHTSNIVITPTEHRSSVSIPYEISIPKSEITLQPPQVVRDTDVESVHVETQVLSQSGLTWKSPEMMADSNYSDSGFESSSINTKMTGWRSQHHHGSREDSLPEMRNVTVRSTWRNKGATSLDNNGQVIRMDGYEDEAESTTMCRAYRAMTVLDADETVAVTTITTPLSVTSRTAKPSPAEVYMRRINSAVTAKEVPEPVRRSRSSLSPTEGLRKPVQHEPVSAQELQPWNRAQSPAVEETASPSLSSWKKQASADLGSSSWTSKAETAGKKPAAKPELWRGQGARAEARATGARHWNQRHTDN